MSEIKVLTDKKFNLTIEESAYNDLKIVTDICKDEVGCILEAEKIENKNIITYKINKVHLPKQEVHGATCELDAESQDEIVRNLEDPNVLRGWFHSHVSMSVSPSSQDNTTFKELYENIDNFYIMLIMNKGGSSYAEIVDKKENVIIKGLPLTRSITKGTFTYEEWKKEIEEKVEELLPKRTTYLSHYDYYNDNKKKDKTTKKKGEKNNNKLSSCEYCGVQQEENLLVYYGGLNICTECIEDMKDDGSLFNGGVY